MEKGHGGGGHHSHHSAETAHRSSSGSKGEGGHLRGFAEHLTEEIIPVGDKAVTGFTEFFAGRGGTKH